LSHLGHYDAAVVWEREQVGRPEEVEAPNGVRAVEHRLEGESRVRAETGASYTVEDGDPTAVQVEAGALWVSVPPGGVEVQVNHGGFSALVSGGAVMVDAGEGSDGLLLVTSGEALLVDAAGTSRALTAGDAAVLGADGDLAGVDQVSEDELAGDPWAVANRALDEEVVLAADDLDESEAVETTDEAEPADEVESAEEEPEEAAEADEGEPVDEDVEELEDLDEDLEDDVDHEAPGFIETSAVEVLDEDEDEPRDSDGWVPPPPRTDDEDQGELLDELYAPGETAGAHEVSGRSVARVLEVAALIVFVGVIVLLVFLFNRDDEGSEPAAIGNGVSTIQPTTTDSTTTTTTERETTTTALPVTVKINIAACTQKGEALVASGRVEGAPKDADGYRITVEVRLDDRTFGKKTVTVKRGSGEKGRRDWVAEIPLNGDAVGAGAECKIPKGGVSLV
jgi:hypothetical protein